MASILDKYGIKEVADVVFYEMDSKGAPSAPVLYLDTLKVSTIEQSAEVVDATGGKGNVKLISWDTNKEVTATFEDALFSTKSLAIMFGGSVEGNGENQEVLKTMSNKAVKKSDSSNVWKLEIGKYTLFLAAAKGSYFKYSTDGKNVVPVASSTVTAAWGTDPTATFDFMTFDILDATTTASGSIKPMVDGLTITIDNATFGGTYYITGDTYARNYQSGQDEFLQFIIPKGKVSSEDLSLTMEADGDPATFSMSIKVLKAEDGTMFKLVKYTLKDNNTGDSNKNKGVASVLTSYDASGVENAGYTSSASKVTSSKPSSAVTNG